MVFPDPTHFISNQGLAGQGFTPYLLSDTSSDHVGLFLALTDNCLPVWHMLIIIWIPVEPFVRIPQCQGVEE